MDRATKQISEFIRSKGFNLSDMSRKTEIPYGVLYASLCNDNRDRDLCKVLIDDVCMGNPGTSAQANRNWFESLKNGQGTRASCHCIIGLSGENIQLIPEEETSWCTNSANSYTISIEAAGYAVTGWQEIGGKCYYLNLELVIRWNVLCICQTL